jgi:hydrogenase maturation protein HypF
MSADLKAGRRIEIRGTVQGVGMRPWIHRLAVSEGVTGRVWNHSGGVTIEAFAPAARLEAFVAALAAAPPPAARTDALTAAPIAVEELDRFVITESHQSPARELSIPPDLCVCQDCLHEIADPANRRYRYPFTNCTNCGPRFTIARDVPYDRAATTMAPFAMCEACRREYDDPLDRRFHAQPNACPVCGPRLLLLDAGLKMVETTDVVLEAARALRAGHVVAVKGIGGFHLACDASSPDAVRRLRERKHRDEKPFAVMVRTLEEAASLARLDDRAETLLASVERPIVLLPRRADAPIAGGVAPRNPRIGVMLAYTPLHHLLLADAGVPLVMTSGNVTDEPIAYENDDACARLAGIADAFLLHDRRIVTRCDDSVVALIDGAPAVLRRARGFVPRPIALRTPAGVPVLGCGALLKNTFCLAAGEQAWLGPHIGDLEHTDTFEAYVDAIAWMERLVGIHPELVAHDLHPDYLSTHYARERGLPARAVQHHHAHVASAIAEHGLDGPVLGVAFDGTGYGTDGTAWGGEFLAGDAAAVRRLATLRPVRLAGGDRAIRQPWRIALALAEDAMSADAVADLPLFERVPAAAVRGVRQMLEAGVNTPGAHGVGRYFDGIAALVLARPQVSYEGQLACELEYAAAPWEDGVYDYAIDRGAAPFELDLRPMVRAIVRDLHAGTAAALIAARFHNTVAHATAAVVRAAASAAGLARPTVVLTGGCFQNARLAASTRAQLESYDVRLHQRVPPGDGGIALGQAVAAAAAAAR